MKYRILNAQTLTAEVVVDDNPEGDSQLVYVLDSQDRLVVGLEFLPGSNEVNVGTWSEDDGEWLALGTARGTHPLGPGR